MWLLMIILRGVLNYKNKLVKYKFSDMQKVMLCCNNTEGQEVFCVHVSHKYLDM